MSAADGALQVLAQWPGARWLQASGTAYLCVSAAHILGIALLLGAILPLDVRMLRGAGALSVLAPAAIRTAATGLAIALPTGVWLFSVAPVSYVANPAFRWKLAVLALALGNVAVQHLLLRRGGGWAGAVPGPMRALAGVSVGAWLAVLLAGRWIGFA